MKLSKFAFTIVFLIISLNCKSQTKTSRIKIVQPTVQQEATSIWRTINDINFLEKQGYTINLPKIPLIDSLVVKSKLGTFGNADFSSIYSLVETRLLDQKNYEKAIQKVEGQIDLISNLIDEIEANKSKWDWNFNIFDNYRVIFTLYGTGGSYDPDKGVITLFTNEAGEFMNYKNPANTIIHEITHMGMEYSIVRKHNLTHGLKERIVDTFVFLMFKEELPEYKIQNMGDVKIDIHLRTAENISSLNTIISKFLNE